MQWSPADSILLVVAHACFFFSRSRRSSPHPDRSTTTSRFPSTTFPGRIPLSPTPTPIPPLSASWPGSWAGSTCIARWGRKAGRTEPGPNLESNCWRFIRIGEGLVSLGADFSLNRDAFLCSDPNSMETLGRFDDSIDWAATGGFTDEDVEEAKVSVFSAVSVANYFVSRASSCLWLPIQSSINR